MSIVGRGFGEGSGVISRGFGLSTFQMVFTKFTNAIYFIRNNLNITFLEKQTNINRR